MVSKNFEMKAFKFLVTRCYFHKFQSGKNKNSWSPVQLQLLNNAISNEWVGCVLRYTEGCTHHLTVNNAEWTLLSRVHVGKYFSLIQSIVKHANRIDSCGVGNGRELYVESRPDYRL